MKVISKGEPNDYVYDNYNENNIANRIEEIIGLTDYNLDIRENAKEEKHIIHRTVVAGLNFGKK